MESLRKKRKTAARDAFTLIELMVVVAILGILIGLTIPAIQAAREAARRAKCSNNLKQVALAVHLYEESHKSFPALCTSYKRYHNSQESDSGSKIDYCGAQIFLLPYLEQEALFQEFDDFATGLPDESHLSGFHVREPFPPNYPNVYTKGTHPKHWGAMVKVSALICSSDGEAASLTAPSSDYDRMVNMGYKFNYTDWQFSRNNVMFNMGDASIFNTDIDSESTNRGVFTPHSWKSLASVHDGLSNTLCVSESISGNATKYMNYTLGNYPSVSQSRRDVAAAPNAFDLAGKAMRPSECLKVTNAVDPARLDSVQPFGNRGTYWFEGRPLSNGFAANLPPNTVACSHDAMTATSLIGGVSSFHFGGVNAAMLDGSVRFLSDNIDCGDLDSNQVTKGASPYGVFGALGSINGGESESL